MIQGFLFNRIDTKTAAATVSAQHHSIADALPYKAEAALSFIQLTKARTESAFDTTIRQHRPPPTGIIGLCQTDHFFAENIITSSPNENLLAPSLVSTCLARGKAPRNGCLQTAVPWCFEIGRAHV